MLVLGALDKLALFLKCLSHLLVLQTECQAKEFKFFAIVNCVKSIVAGLLHVVSAKLLLIRGSVFSCQEKQCRREVYGRKMIYATL